MCGPTRQHHYPTTPSPYDSAHFCESGIPSDGLPLSYRHAECAGRLPGSSALLLAELLCVGSAGGMLTPGAAPSKLISSFWVSVSLDFRDPRLQPCAPCRCLHLGLCLMSPLDTAVPPCPPTPLLPLEVTRTSWLFVLTQTVSVSLAIVEMHRVKSNLIFFGRKIKFSTL